MYGKQSGTKVASILVGAIVATLGVTAVWLPYYADRDKIRGLHEESDPGPRARREYEKIIRQMEARKEGGREQK